MAELCAVAKVIVVEVNQNLPYCLGAGHNGIHISKVDMIVEGSNPPVPQLPAGAPTEVDQQVARLVLEEIPDGACIQLGIGGMPNAVGALIAQSDLKDLGVHTEMLVDSFVDMAAAGKLTGERKRLDRGRHVYTFGAGTQKLYDFLHNNPFAYNAPVNYVNDVRVIAQLDDFMSINNCINVDLFGQVSSETSGLKHISGAGGQQDFLLGAYLSNGGKSFICCSSTAQEKGGASVSRILPTLPEGSVVTATRTNIQYLVTEYGKVNLKGKSTWQRAEAIISVAHPDHREELIAAAERMGIWRGSNRK
ncbi:Butanoate coenzyme A-transferase [bioreactor metagenome]|uniref:Butanoate coenzyme A-transferase n=1 Tax=bioreactor metagenome TaxID=1076179 RepID=A0A645EXR2_9ZZZZ